MIIALLIVYMKTLLDSDWLRAVQLLCNSVQKRVILCRNLLFRAITTTKMQPDCPRDNANQNKLITRNKKAACRHLTCYAWCEKKLDSGCKAQTVANLLIIVNVNAKNLWYIVANPLFQTLRLLVCFLTTTTTPTNLTNLHFARYTTILNFTSSIKWIRPLPMEPTNFSTLF